MGRPGVTRVWLMLLGGSGGAGMAGNMIEKGGGNRMLKGKGTYRIILVQDIPKQILVLKSKPVCWNKISNPYVRNTREPSHIARWYSLWICWEEARNRIK